MIRTRAYPMELYVAEAANRDRKQMAQLSAAACDAISRPGRTRSHRAKQLARHTAVRPSIMRFVSQRVPGELSDFVCFRTFRFFGKAHFDENCINAVFRDPFVLAHCTRQCIMVTFEFARFSTSILLKGCCCCCCIVNIATRRALWCVFCE